MTDNDPAIVPVFTTTTDTDGQVLDTKMTSAILLPAPPGTCPDCARPHDPALPHDQQSLHWQYRFYGRNLRWPTWTDAMAHCAPETQDAWTQALAEHGIEV